MLYNIIFKRNRILRLQCTQQASTLNIMKMMATIMMPSQAMSTPKSALTEKRVTHTTTLILTIRSTIILTNTVMMKDINTVKKTITITTTRKMTPQKMLKLLRNSILPHLCQSSSLPLNLLVVSSPTVLLLCSILLTWLPMCSVSASQLWLSS